MNSPRRVGRVSLSVEALAKSDPLHAAIVDLIATEITVIPGNLISQ